MSRSSSLLSSSSSSSQSSQNNDCDSFTKSNKRKTRSNSQRLKNRRQSLSSSGTRRTKRVRKRTHSSGTNSQPMSARHPATQTPQNLNIKCTFVGCDAVLSSAELLKKHVNDKHQSVTFDCVFPGCNSSYILASQLDRHIASKHVSIAHGCIFHGCSKSYQRPSKLRHHILKKHMVESFICEFDRCGKHFLTHIGLRNHISHKHKSRTITFHCNECVQTFSSSAELHEHALICASNHSKSIPSNQKQSLLTSKTDSIVDKTEQNASFSAVSQQSRQFSSVYKPNQLKVLQTIDNNNDDDDDDDDDDVSGVHHSLSEAEASTSVTRSGVFDSSPLSSPSERPMRSKSIQTHPHVLHRMLTRLSSKQAAHVHDDDDEVVVNHSTVSHSQRLNSLSVYEQNDSVFAGIPTDEDFSMSEDRLNQYTRHNNNNTPPLSPRLSSPWIDHNHSDSSSNVKRGPRQLRFDATSSEPRLPVALYVDDVAQPYQTRRSDV